MLKGSLGLPNKGILPPVTLLQIPNLPVLFSFSLCLHPTVVVGNSATVEVVDSEHQLHVLLDLRLDRDSGVTSTRIVPHPSTLQVYGYGNMLPATSNMLPATKLLPVCCPVAGYKGIHLHVAEIQATCCRQHVASSNNVAICCRQQATCCRQQNCCQFVARLLLYTKGYTYMLPKYRQHVAGNMLPGVNAAGGCRLFHASGPA